MLTPEEKILIFENYDYILDHPYHYAWFKETSYSKGIINFSNNKFSNSEVSTYAKVKLPDYIVDTIASRSTHITLFKIKEVNDYDVITYNSFSVTYDYLKRFYNIYQILNG